MGLLRQADAQSRNDKGSGSEGELEILARERIQLLRERDDLVGERDRLRRELEVVLEERQRLEDELARRRAPRPERTTDDLFRQANDYVTSMRADARRDAELTLRKARARADEVLGELEHERRRAERELRRLQALASETRARLEQFTTSALRQLAPAPDEPRGHEAESERP